MKNVLRLLSIALVLLNVATPASAQIVTQNGKDTAFGYYNSVDDSVLEIDNRIKSGSTSNVLLRWKLASTNLGAVPGWDILGSGICDNVICQSATIYNASNNVFNNGITYQSDPYNNASFTGTAHDFHVLMHNTNPPNGSSAYIRVLLQDTVSKTSRTLTFIGMKASTGIMNFNSADDIILYPNPAREAVNVIFDEKFNVRTIAVYNLIGKLMGPIYKPASNNSAKIDLSDMPTGIYFLRLMDAQGHFVATRRFTRQ